MKSIIEFKEVKKYFRAPLQHRGKGENLIKAVDGVDLAIREGESISIVGESGCGKTTLARLMIGLYASDEGKILFDQYDVTQLKSWTKKLRRLIQMVFQDPYSSLDPRFTIREVLYEPMSLAPELFKEKNQREEAIKQMLKTVGLSDEVADRYPHEFSGGERQRIVIARALVVQPKVLILDEAVSSLDVIIQKQILDLLNELRRKQNLTYVFITHNLRVARQISDRIAVMMQGKIVEVNTTEVILNQPQHFYTKQLLAAALDYRVD